MLAVIEKRWESVPAGTLENGILPSRKKIKK